MSRKRIVACCTLHNGLEWLSHSMRSVDPFVDEIRIYYTEEPSHGHKTDLVCPEPRSAMKKVADGFGAYWHDGAYSYEGQHRDFAYGDCAKAGADIILVVDADEIWLPENLLSALKFVQRNPEVRRWRVNMLHFWRSLGWVCRDGMWPERIHVPSGFLEGYIPPAVAQPLHMGYAQTPGLVYYKIRIHGHRAEFRFRWFEDKFMAWEPGMKDVHPTCEDTWTPEPYNRAQIADVVGDHPYFQLDLIE